MREEATAKLRDGLLGTLIEHGDAAYDDARQEEQMSDFNQTTIDDPAPRIPAPRWERCGLGLAGLMPGALHAQPAPTRSDGPNWPGILKGRHRQVVNAYEVNSGFPLAFAYTFLAPTSRQRRSSFFVMARSRSRSAARCGPNTRSANGSRSSIRKRRRRR